MSTESIANLAEALVAFQADMPVVGKTKTARVPTKAGGEYTYTYADLAVVQAAALPLLVKHGLAFSVTPRGTEHGFVVEGHLIHTSGESLSASLPLQGRAAQEIGSSLTYARRYLLGCLTGIVTDDDDDAQAANQAKRTQMPMKPSTRGQMFALFSQKGIPEEAQLAGINQITGEQYESRGDLTEAHAKQVIAALHRKPDAVKPEEPPANTPDATPAETSPEEGQ